MAVPTATSARRERGSPQAGSRGVKSESHA
jgi:hypothetical protein